MSDHVTAITGSTERLSCSAVGYPAPELVWYKDGVPLTVDGQEEDTITEDGRTLVKQTTHLVLRDVVPADSGQYHCTAFNIHGNVSFVYSLLVLGQLLSTVFTARCYAEGKGKGTVSR